jgi:putative YphP/YqiW family bacilliredoxin
MYDERFITPMRQELTRIGVEEMRTPDEVDAKLKEAKGTTLLVVNSMCGCAARNARPAVASALQNAVKPDHLTAVFAGQDIEATARARSYITAILPAHRPSRSTRMVGWSSCSNATRSRVVLRRPSRRISLARSTGILRCDSLRTRLRSRAPRPLVRLLAAHSFLPSFSRQQ